MPRLLDAPLPTPNNPRTHTALCSLAAKVSPKGPCIASFPDLPPGAPYWEGRVQHIPKQKDWDYTAASATLVNLGKDG